MPFSLKRQFWVRGTLTAAAVAGCILPLDALTAAGGGSHRQAPQASVGLWDGYQAPCKRCDQSWIGYGSADCGCQSQRPRRPFLGLLDSVAGGVEFALGLSGPRSAACDEVACDDGCDALTRHHLQGPTYLAPAPPPSYPAIPELRDHEAPRPLPFAPDTRSGRAIERVPAPRPRPEASDPFADEPVGSRPINPAISPSAYFE